MSLAASPEAARDILEAVGGLQKENGGWDLDDRLASALGVEVAALEALLGDVEPAAREAFVPLAAITVCTLAVQRAAVQATATEAPSSESKEGLRERRRGGLRLAEASSCHGSEMMAAAARLDEEVTNALTMRGHSLAPRRKIFQAVEALLRFLTPLPSWQAALAEKNSKRRTGEVAAAASGTANAADTAGEIHRRWREFGPAPALDDLDWSTCAATYLAEGGCGGAVLARLEQGVVVVKQLAVPVACASMLAETLFVRSARLRAVRVQGEDKGRGEGARVVAALLQARPDVEESCWRIRNLFWSAEFLGLVEFIPGTVMVGLEAKEVLGRLPPDQAVRVWHAIGRLAAFDALINNWDRVPLLWDNEGNVGNVMLMSSEDGCAAVGIDHVFTAIIPGPGREKYLERLRDMVNATTGPGDEMKNVILPEARCDSDTKFGQWSLVTAFRRVRHAFRVCCGAEPDLDALVKGCGEAFVDFGRLWRCGLLRDELEGVSAKATATFAESQRDNGLLELPSLVEFFSATAQVVAETAPPAVS